MRLPYCAMVKPGVRVLHETIAASDLENSRITPIGGAHDADYLVIALGADYDMDATPGPVRGRE